MRFPCIALILTNIFVYLDP